MNKDRALRDHLLYLLGGGGAHADIEALIADFPVDLVNERIQNLPYTPWQVLEHLRIAQWDILEFSRNPKHVSPEFPSGYWPAPDAAADAETWKKTVEAYLTDLEQMKNLVADPSTDLLARIPHGADQTILREALLAADHNAYHLGALFVMKRILVETKARGQN